MNLNGYDVIVRDGSAFIDDELIGYVWKNDTKALASCYDVPPTGWGCRRNDRYDDARDGFKTRRAALEQLVYAWRLYRDEAERNSFDAYLAQIDVEGMTDEALEAERSVAQAQHEATVECWNIASLREGLNSKAAQDLALSGDKVLARAAFYADEAIRRAAEVDRPLWQLLSESSRLRVMERLEAGPLDERARLDLANFASSRIVETTDRDGEPIELDLGTVDCYGERSVYLGPTRLGFVKGWAPYVA